MHLTETTTRERVLKLNEADIVAVIKAHYKLDDWDSYVLTVEKRDQGCGQGFLTEIQLRMRNNEPPAFHTVNEPPAFHAVVEGDTLTSIALRFLKGEANPLSVLMGLNPQIKDPNRIYPGDKIRLR